MTIGRLESYIAAGSAIRRCRANLNKICITRRKYFINLEAKNVIDTLLYVNVHQGKCLDNGYSQTQSGYVVANLQNKYAKGENIAGTLP